jgi:hypothetical protein
MTRIVLESTPESSHESHGDIYMQEYPFPPTRPDNLNEQLESGDAEMQRALGSIHVAISREEAWAIPSLAVSLTV